MSGNEILDLVIGLILSGVITFFVGAVYHKWKKEYDEAERKRLAEEEKEETQDDD